MSPLLLVYALGFVVTLYWSVTAVAEHGRRFEIGCVSWAILVFCSVFWPLVLPWIIFDYVRDRWPIKF